VITLQVPNDANRSQVVVAAQVNDLVHNFRRCFAGMVDGDG
jgi:hypothetical protein